MVCRCACGTVKAVNIYTLQHISLSCGCLRREATRQRSTKHGARRRGQPVSKEYSAWAQMLGRCYQRGNTSFHNYGARGIRVARVWRNDFSAFMRDMGQAPSPAHSLDRIDVSRGYGPDNCRWATRGQQSNNTRRNIRVRIGGQTKTLTQWGDTVGIGSATMNYRFRRGGWRGRRLLTPLQNQRSWVEVRIVIDGVARSLGEWADSFGHRRDTVCKRYRSGLRGHRLFAPV